MHPKPMLWLFQNPKQPNLNFQGMTFQQSKEIKYLGATWDKK